MRPFYRNHRLVERASQHLQVKAVNKLSSDDFHPCLIRKDLSLLNNDNYIEYCKQLEKDIARGEGRVSYSIPDFLKL
jgi:hypothetical protein